MRILSLVLFTIVFKINYSQVISENELTKYKWVVSEVEIFSKSKTEKNKQEKFRKAFLKTYFVFDSNKTCKIHSKMVEFTNNNAFWEFDEKFGIIKIYELNTKQLPESLLIEIKIKKAQNDLFFESYDSGFEMKMKMNRESL